MVWFIRNSTAPWKIYIQWGLIEIPTGKRLLNQAKPRFRDADYIGVYSLYNKFRFFLCLKNIFNCASLTLTSVFSRAMHGHRLILHLFSKVRFSRVFTYSKNIINV